MRLAAAAAHFGRDLDLGVARATGIIEEARLAGASLLVLPHGVLGGYLDDLGAGRAAVVPPPALRLGDERITGLAAAAGPLVVCFGFTEEGPGGQPWNTAVCLSGDGVLGVHRKVHLAGGEVGRYRAGERCEAFDTPLGRIGMLIDYDKTFPEAARSLALDGATLLAFVCAWPLSLTSPAARLSRDRQSVLFDTYDRARAAENQVVVVTSNLSGSQGRLRFLSQAKVVLPDGSVVARTGFRPGLAVADVDVEAVVGHARRHLHHLVERRPDAYLQEVRAPT